MKLNPQFRAFLSEIRPTDRQKEDWKTGTVTLLNRLAKDEDLGKIVVATFLQGSVRRSTAIRPSGDKRPDVDIVVVTNIDHNTTTPSEAMAKFDPFLERHYSGKWRPQGRSFGIELSYVDLDLVITALPADKTSRDIMERLYRSKSVMTTASIEDDPSWRLNENWSSSSESELSLTPLKAATSGEDAPESEWRPHPLYLPDREVGYWGRTHPLAQIQWTAAKNRLCNGHYVNLVRVIKWWRQINSSDLPKYPKGYPLEHMIGHVLLDGTTTMAEGLVQALESIRDTWAKEALLGQVPVLCDHGVPEHNVLSRLSIEDFKEFHNAVSAAATKARQALDSEDAQESGKLWQELLGTKFPLPGPQGGDRSQGGFTPPIIPADPPKTERFA